MNRTHSKIWMSFLACWFLLLLLLPVRAFAAEQTNAKFSFQLEAESKDTIEVQQGDVITVTLKLKRTDSQEAYTMYGMQDEILYDSTFFELVESEPTVSQGVIFNDIATVDDYRAAYLNYLSMSGGNTWKPETAVGSFQLRVIAENGVSKIKNSNVLVSLPDGSGSYECDKNELTVILTTDCTVRFMTRGGNDIADVIVQYGEKIKRPDDPTRESYTFAGWYKNIDLTEEWDFDTDTVEGNMSLYAKWIEGEVEPVEVVHTQSKFSWWILIVVLGIIVGGCLMIRKRER